MESSARILLLSTSTLFGGGYLAYAEDEIRDFLGPTRRVLFIPFALHDHNAYAGRVRKSFVRIGYELESLHEATDAVATVKGAEALFIGGGNTFRLLSSLYEWNLLDAIRRSRDAISWLERGFECRRAHDQDDQRHAYRATAFL